MPYGLLLLTGIWNHGPGSRYHPPTNSPWNQAFHHFQILRSYILLMRRRRSLTESKSPGSLLISLIYWIHCVFENTIWVSFFSFSLCIKCPFKRNVASHYISSPSLPIPYSVADYIVIFDCTGSKYIKFSLQYFSYSFPIDTAPSCIFNLYLRDYNTDR